MTHQTQMTAALCMQEPTDQSDHRVKVHHLPSVLNYSPEMTLKKIWGIFVVKTKSKTCWTCICTSTYYLPFAPPPPTPPTPPAHFQGRQEATKHASQQH